MDESILFEMYRGDDHALRMEITGETGLPVDITGWLFKSTMTLNPHEANDDGATVKVDIGPLTGGDATNGIVIINLPNEQTKNLLASRYYFDIQGEVNNTVRTIISGRVLVKIEATQRVG